MRIPFRPMALAGGQLAARSVSPSSGHELASRSSAYPPAPPTHPVVTNETTSARLLLTTTGTLLVADYDGSSFDIKMNETITGTPSWVHFAEPDRLYVPNEGAADLRLFEFQVGGPGGDVRLNPEPLHNVNGSTGVVHLETTPDGSYLVASAYGNGTIDVWDVQNGFELLNTIESTGSPGPVQPNQASSHPHQAVVDNTGHFFAVNDLGTDEILIIDARNNLWDVTSTVPTPEGCGPRHGTFFPSKAAVPSHYIVVCELSNNILVYIASYSGDSLTLSSPVISESTYGPNATVPETAAAGGLVLAPNDVDLYVSNRLTGDESDAIAHFKIGPGMSNLRWAGSTPSGGVLPRMFSLSTDSRTLFVGNQRSGLGLVALGLQPDGSIIEEPKASLPRELFGAEDFGPPYVQQIR